MGDPVGLGLALGGVVGAQIGQGQQAKQAQRRALRDQELAQAKAEARALSGARKDAQERRRLNRKQPSPDLDSELSRSGPAATLLTGPSRTKATLGRTSLLGGG